MCYHVFTRSTKQRRQARRKEDTMTRDDIRATLEKQLQLLSERSAKETGAALAAMSEAMEHISEFLFRTSRDSYLHDS